MLTKNEVKRAAVAMLAERKRHKSHFRGWVTVEVDNTMSQAEQDAIIEAADRPGQGILIVVKDYGNE